MAGLCDWFRRCCRGPLAGCVPNCRTVFTVSTQSLNQCFMSETECVGTLCLCCCTLSVALSMFFRVWVSFNLLRMFYVLIFWASLSLSQITSKNKLNKTGTSGCGSFLVAYFQPATCIDRLHVCSQQGDIRQQQQQQMTN